MLENVEPVTLPDSVVSAPSTAAAEVTGGEKSEKADALQEGGAASAEEVVEVVVEPLPRLTGVVILPPRQKQAGSAGDSNGTHSNFALPLPPIRPEEPVQSLRLALAEVVGLAHFTNYRIEVEEEEKQKEDAETALSKKGSDASGGKGKKVPTQASKDSLPLVSPFTGRNAVVCIPAALKTLNQAPTAATVSGSSDAAVSKQYDSASGSNVLDEFGDLQGIPSQASLRLVLERYDAASVKEHVLRLRNLFDGNAPYVVSLADEEEEEEDRDSGENGQHATEEAEKKEGGVEVNDTQQQMPKSAPPLADLPALDSARVDGKNLADFFYLCAGEDASAFLGSGSSNNHTNGKSKKKKSKAGGNSSPSRVAETNANGEGDFPVPLPTEVVREKLYRLNQLEEFVQMNCTIEYSGFHPPPPVRRMMGDIAYLAVTFFPDDGDESKHDAVAPVVLHVTASTCGFFVNKTRAESNSARRMAFDPSPRHPPESACFSHTLLDCLLQASPDGLARLWKRALGAALERSELTSEINKGPFSTLFRLAIRADVGGYADATLVAKAQSALDSTLGTPSWLVRVPTSALGSNDEASWNRNRFHPYALARAEEDLAQTFGVDVRNGALRDWNEELQLAREMPTSTLVERLERARVIHKTMTEFGEASLLAVKAICEGQIASMNPNEGTRTQVYLHNNIFVSRALDVGPETFRLVKGDRAAHKSASREIQCIKTFHRMEGGGGGGSSSPPSSSSGCFHTLATVLIDYLGSRFICQSILPGILQGEKSHTILLGSVDVEVPMKCDAEFQRQLHEKIGEPLNLLNRPVFTSPLTDERRKECQTLKRASLLMAGLLAPTGQTSADSTKKDEEVDRGETMITCAPLETKGIRGSDQRNYLLDFGRMTPRDANWVAQEKGGTGKWEELTQQQQEQHEDDSNNGSSGGGSATSAIPSTLDDEEWTMNVLRPELINQWIRHVVSKYIEQKRSEAVEAAAAKKNTGEDSAEDGASGSPDGENEEQNGQTKADDDQNGDDTEKFKMTEEEQKELTDSLRLNVNVFLPDVRTVDPDQMKLDEEKVREASIFLWDEVLPRVTRAVRERGISPLPMDGKTLTEFLHRKGLNCRYLGRLATLARLEEQRDAKTNEDLKHGRLTVFSRRTMPHFWLELLECEMVARAAKHVLDSYLMEDGGAATTQPAQLAASFLSAIVSEREETAGQTETRLEKSDPGYPDEDDLEALTVFNVGGDGDALPAPARSRYEVWQDIELEVGRRFRYSLVLFNKGNKTGRANHVALLRRVCQRTGIRLLAKNYEVGGRCFTEGNTTGGRLTASYPISPVDVVDIVPLMKHSAAYFEGFSPCALQPALATPPLQISLYDARLAFERAHLQMSAATSSAGAAVAGRGLSRALELAQESASLYQRVTENGAHPGIVECLELMANVFLEASDLPLAIDNGSKALGLAVQSGGFDGPNVFNVHIIMFQMLFAARQYDQCVKHLRAAMYILEISSGPRHVEHYDALHKLGAVYSNEEYKGKYSETAVKIFRELEHVDPNDRLLEGFTLRALAKSLVECGEYKEAVEVEKRANKSLARFVGKEHAAMKESDHDLQKYTELAVREGNRSEEKKLTQEREMKAQAMAANLVAEEGAKKKKQNKKKKGKK